MTPARDLKQEEEAESKQPQKSTQDGNPTEQSRRAILESNLGKPAAAKSSHRLGACQKQPRAASSNQMQPKQPEAARSSQQQPDAARCCHKALGKDIHVLKQPL